MDNGLSKNDPYRGMESAKQNMTPDFLKRTKDDQKSDAAASLASAESNATENGITRTENGLANVLKTEESASGFYSGQGKERAGKTKRGLLGILRKRGPIGFIIAAILGTGGLIGGAQMLQPFSLLEQFRETFNSMQTSTSLRSNNLFKMQMDSGRVKNPIKAKIFSSDTFKISSKQASKLSNQGIYYDDNFEGSGLRVLKFDDGTGELKIVAADEATAVRLTEMDLGRYDADVETGMKYNAEAISFKNLYSDNADFFNGYNSGSLTWRGAIANWFGTLTQKFLSSNKLTRNLFQDFQQKVAAENDGNTRTVAPELMAKGTDDIQEGGARAKTVGEDTDEEGDPTGTYHLSSTEEEPNSSFKRSSIQSESDVRSKLEELGDKYSGGSIMGTAQKVANFACLGLNFVGGVSLFVSASEAIQVINLVTAYFEAIDKVKAGDGDDSPIHDLANALNEQKTNEHTTLDASGISSTTTSTTKTAMESSGIASLYGGGAVNVNDASVQSFNFTKSIKRILGGIGVSMAAFEGCSFAKLATNAVSAVQSGLEIGACIAGIIGSVFTLGATATACTGLVSDILAGVALSVGIGVLISGIISTITPVVAKILTRDLITNIGGEDLGNALTSGANMYLGNTHRSNGGSLASEAQYVAFAIEQQQVIAENAKYERMTRSPFDTSSQYTFLGTLATQLIAFASANSLSSVVKSSSSVISSSIIAMTPTATAASIADNLIPLDEYAEICPYLASIGAVGDAYCNPYSITDVSTMGYDPADVTDRLDDNFKANTTDDGNVVIDEKSDLAKYILFCDQRTSAFGIADQNIVNDVSDWGQVDFKNASFNTAANSAIGAVPVVGDVIDVIDNGQALANTGYISGESCVAGNNVSNASAPGWNTAKYYQRFIEDQSLAESMGLIEKSAVTAFLDDYYEQNPLDQSYEGILARYSGLEKEDVIALLDIMEYETYIANYDPSTRYAFVTTDTPEAHILFEESNFFAPTYGFEIIAAVYNDIRNRSFAV